MPYIEKVIKLYTLHTIQYDMLHRNQTVTFRAHTNVTPNTIIYTPSTSTEKADCIAPAKCTHDGKIFTQKTQLGICRHQADVVQLKTVNGNTGSFIIHYF